jgi:S-layer homology domain
MNARGVGSTMGILVLGLFASASGAQSYGPESQVRTVGAAEFRSLDSSDAYVDAFGYLRWAGEDVHLAPLALPDGAVIDTFCLYADDSDPDPAKLVWSHVVAIKQVPEGELPGLLVVGPEVFSGNGGYQKVCKTVAETVKGRIDVDGDGNPDPVAYYVHLQFPSSPSFLGAGGVEITWRRQVSAPTSQTFSDVPSSDPGFGYIEALAASGITAGCSQIDYCPDANLTRRQMAVFLAKALGLHWAD